MRTPPLAFPTTTVAGRARRARLRFLLQEIDLALGATVIGRDEECHVTLCDPLVSRRHARVLVGSDRTVVEDLGSRNGVYVNGLAVRAPAPLRDGDRIRVGTQEMIYSEIAAQRATDEPPPHARATGHLRLCAICHMAYAREAGSCPACEATERVVEDTLVQSARRPA